MKRFKLPLIVTGVSLVVGMLVAVLLITMVHNSKLSSRQKKERAAMLGSAVGVGICVTAAPFWFVAAAKVGKERRAKRNGGRK